ncbi:MAG TPA: Si-specific NAD(P)(+) transhydrogenase [Bryobacteraceae bacterium]|nr:Si-specific NAD(P)(+) transhydrogenase [Bryobacteraceae bacterium]
MSVTPEFDYDLLVLGSGPAGQRAAIQAAKLDKRVAIVEKKTVVGGVSVNTGTIPSKTLREAVLYLSGYRERNFYGAAYSVKHNITMEDLMLRTDQVIRHEIDVTRHQLLRNRVDVISATGSFVDAHTILLESSESHTTRTVTASRVVLAVGTEATVDSHIPVDKQRVFTSDEILKLDKLPRSLTVVGAGVIGCEYASMFAALGVRVTLIDKRPRLLPFVDEEISDALAYHLRENRVTLRLGEEVSGMEQVDDDDHCPRVRINLASGKQVITDKALYSIGRTGNTSRLNLQAAGLKADDRGRLKVNEHYQTEVPNIYGVGDLIGFPSLASTSMEQGRIAACHAFALDAHSVPELFPYGIYTIPEISMVGKNEEDLTRDGIPYEIGKARYREIARGQIIGDSTGLLKLIFNSRDRRLLAVHIIGEGASDLVHIGQAVMSYGGVIDYFIDTVFNYPTLAECYKTAAFDGINRLGV